MHIVYVCAGVCVSLYLCVRTCKCCAPRSGGSVKCYAGALQRRHGDNFSSFSNCCACVIVSLCVCAHVFESRFHLLMPCMLCSPHHREECYQHMNARVPDDLKYDLHVLLVAHGKRYGHTHIHTERAIDTHTYKQRAINAQMLAHRDIQTLTGPVHVHD